MGIFYSLLGIVFILLVSLPASSFANSGIEECDFYIEKAEELGCSDANYLVKFGYKYCRLFVRKNYKFSKRGKNVFQEIRSCLIAELEVYGNQLTCRNVKRVAERSHRGCYFDAGFCETRFSDKWRVLRMVWKELFDRDFFRVMAQVNSDCQPEEKSDQFDR